MIKLINKTHYNSEYLSSIVNECVIITGCNKIRKIVFKYHRNWINNPIMWVGGYAYVGGSTIIIKLPESDQWDMRSNIGELTEKSQLLTTVLIHEIGHLIRVEHNIGLTIEHLYEEQIKKYFNDGRFPLK